MTDILTITVVGTEAIVIGGRLFRPGPSVALGVEPPSTAPYSPYHGEIPTPVQIRWRGDFISQLGEAVRKGYITLTGGSDPSVLGALAGKSTLHPDVYGTHEDFGSSEKFGAICDDIGQEESAYPGQNDPSADIPLPDAPPPPRGPALLTEDGGLLLNEDGSVLLLE